MFAYTADKKPIYFETKGQGPDLLLIMGLSLSSRFWMGLADALSSHFRVIVYDNRGTGRSFSPQVRFGMADMADDALHVLDTARSSRAHVFGISMGGMIAQELALRAPERVARLALGATTAGGISFMAKMLPTGTNLLRAFLSPPENAAKIILPYLVSQQNLSQHPDLMKPWWRVAQSERPNPKGAMLQLLACSLHNTHKRLPSIQAPSLIITGEDDTLIPPRESETLARLIPKADFYRLAGTGHLFPYEKAPETEAVLREFFLRG